MILLMETKIQSKAYYHNRLEYNVHYPKARPSGAWVSQDGVGLVTRERPDWWGVESTRFRGPNLVSFEIVTGPIWTSLVGTYLPPLTLEHLSDAKEALQQFKRRDPIVLGVLTWT